MAGAGEGSFDRQEKFVFQEIVYSGDKAAGNATGGGGVVGWYQPGESGNLQERFASELDLAVEAVEEGGFGGVGEEKGICPGLDASFFGIFIGEIAFGHDALEDAIGATAVVPVLFQVGCVDVKRAARP